MQLLFFLLSLYNFVILILYLLLFSSKSFRRFKLKLDSNNNSNQITSKQLIIINSSLRHLGLNSGHIGTRLINKAIQILTVKDLDIIVLTDIYEEISKSFPNLKPKFIRMYIHYALQHRNEEKAENNFKKIFGFDYDNYYFEPKQFIEEMANIIRIKTMNM